jgi:cell division protein FtsQ
VTNRRQKKRPGRVARAPSEPSGTPPEESDSVDAPKRRSFRRWARSLAGILVALLGAWALAWGAHRYALSTPRFALVDVELVGAKRMTQGELLGLARLELGRNILSLDLVRAEQDLAQSPWIREAHIERRLPGTLRIVLAEREARALGLAEGRLYLVSERGEPFKMAEDHDPKDLPIISGAIRGESSTPAGDEARLRQGIQLLDEYAHSALGTQFAAEELHLDLEGRVVLVIGREGTELHLGLPPYREKLERAQKVLSDSRSLGGLPGTIFLDNAAHPERVIVRAR